MGNYDIIIRVRDSFGDPQISTEVKPTEGKSYPPAEEIQKVLHLLLTEYENA